ncbi:porin family protein [Aquiflexum sp. LQ15W]|uniref:porin family protein n=1 Tax=Cognataquiflexum nitidum TaxID=2922272 RepID=UPI001F137242|nr:porin family protein [Cognataquiflexum nitidum]MCH6201592.1 porin family protein [Cognataquiflexum nitidum]
MKNGFSICLIILALLSGRFVTAQTFEITPTTGYTFSSQFDITGGTGKLEGGANWGISMGYTPNEFLEFEISYNYFGTDARANSVYLVEEEVTKANLHFLMGGVNMLFPASEKVILFGGLKIGAASLLFEDSPNVDRTRFSLGFQGGMRYYVSERIGFRLQGTLLLPIVSEGGSIWWNPNTGTNISGWSPIVPVSMNAGLIIRLQQ